MTTPTVPHTDDDLVALPDDVRQLLEATRTGPPLTGAAREHLWRSIAATTAGATVSVLERPSYPRRGWIARHRWAVALATVAALGGGSAVAVVGLRGRASRTGAAAAAAPPTTGFLVVEVQSTPSGARVTRGQQDLGVTPVGVEVPMNQAVSIHLALPGHEERDVEIPAMRASSGTFEVGLDQCATVFDDMTWSCRRAYCRHAGDPACVRENVPTAGGPP